MGHWAPTYFPNTIEISYAQPIIVHEGSQLDGYVIHLRAAPAYHLRGVVSGDQGKPAGGVEVWLLSEIGWGTGEAQVKSAADGSFDFPSVRAGDWQIVAEVTHGDAQWKGFTAFAMPQHDVDDAATHVGPPFSLATAVEGLPKDGSIKATPSLSLWPVEGPGEQKSHAAVQPDGTLKFETVYPGRYRAGMSSVIPGFYLASITHGTRDAAGRDIELAPGSPPLRAIFKPNAPRATGTVENGAGLKVVFIEADRESAFRGVFLRAAVCDAEGRFQLESLRPTTYYVFAFAIGNVESGAVWEKIFTLGLWKQARSITLAEGATATLNLTMTPWPD